jgi:hypothetical protein
VCHEKVDTIKAAIRGCGVDSQDRRVQNCPSSKLEPLELISVRVFLESLNNLDSH